jgi:hypothetical protein
LRKSTPNVADHLLAEVGWDIVRHYIRADLAQKLKDHVKEIFPESFPVKVMDLKAPQDLADAELDRLIGKSKKKKGKIDKKATPSKKGIDSFFAPITKKK